MREFVYGTDQQYELLKGSLEDHLCHVYSHCYLPDNCSKDIARIGFEKEENTYALFIIRVFPAAVIMHRHFLRIGLRLGL